MSVSAGSGELLFKSSSCRRGPSRLFVRRDRIPGANDNDALCKRRTIGETAVEYSRAARAAAETKMGFASSRPLYLQPASRSVVSVSLEGAPSLALTWLCDVTRFLCLGAGESWPSRLRLRPVLHKNSFTLRRVSSLSQGSTVS